MRIYLEQIPEGVSPSDYPRGTVFVFEERPLQRDPKTFKLIRPKRRKLIYPEDIKEEKNDLLITDPGEIVNK